MSWLPILPLLTCLITAVLCCLLWSRVVAQRLCHLVGSVVLLIVVIMVDSHVVQNGILVMQMSDYAAPFGISFVIDSLGAVMLLITAIIALCVSVYALGDITIHQQNLGFYPTY